ncbi:MAG: DUF4160 domain-containing protein [Deltaproteobacteria bacterium]|nr:MAG: DUF4160 domain-containing protein [Deltaproteobacteria bacterium]
MPEICRFYGIIIAMYFEDHPPPHFHARYGDYKISVKIEDYMVLEGSFPPRALGLVMEWAAKNQEKLMTNWDLAQDSQPLVKIAPLE